MKLKRGNILGCGPDNGCGLKVVVIEACDELDCDLKCCGQDMHLVEEPCEEVWKQFAKETAPEVWKQFAGGEKQE